MKQKPNISTILFILLLVIGFGILLYPTISDRYTKWQLQKEMDQYTEVAEAIKEDYTELWSAAEEYNGHLIQKQSQFIMEEGEAENVSTLLNPLNTGMMGYIDIPKIDVHLPIYQGIEEKALQSGAGYWLGSSLPTGGESTHCVITAHTGLVKAKMFTDIDQLEIGDRFTLFILNRQLTYEVDQIRITEPDEITDLYIVDGEDYVTLYTCYPYGVNTHRLLVRGSRIESTENQDNSCLLKHFTWWQILLFIFILMLLILFLWIVATNKKGKHAIRRRHKHFRKKRK
ncbi:class C sortase [Clostridium sp.]|uniref:class C sortase n=1 Tax=Clostridium sp. TaxID=1506 RepID=UPI0025C4D687|nr:class C sortase [Clostridium sp.]